MLLRSLAFAELLRNLVSGGAYRILDLGSASGQNIEGMSHYAASVQVGDLPASLASPRPHAVENALQSLEADAPESGYHVVLAWDLFNYLSPDELREAARRLGAVTRPGAFLFGLIYYSKEMPAEPPRYRIVDESTLSYPRPERLRPAPRYPQGLIEQTFADFELEHAYLLKTGVQEYLFVRRGPAPPAASTPPAGRPA